MSTRRSFFKGAAAAAAAGAAGAILPGSAGAAQPTAALASIVPRAAAATTAVGKAGFARHLEATYVDPDRVFSGDVRWWLASAAHTDETLLEQIQALYDGGFRGVELCMQSDGTAPDALYAYGSDMWAHKWNLMMNKLLDLGMSVYLTSGTNWSTSNIPGLDPTSQAAMQNLTLATSTVAPGAPLSALPVPAANAQRAGARFVTAYAYKTTAATVVDETSFVALPVTQGSDVWTQTLNWTAPSDGSYLVFAIWTQGTFQTSSPAIVPSYATNYFDDRGVAALRAYWEAHYLADAGLRQKILDGDVQLFMDSLEITPGTAGITWWSEDMAAQFKQRKGYDIMPLVFLMYGLPQVNAVYNAYTPRAQGTYDLAGDPNRREKVINDFLDVLTQMYIEHMLVPIKEWLNSIGIETRAQISYGRSFEISEPIAAVDYPEAENFNQYDQVDIFRLWSGGAKLTNKVLSSESGAELPQYSPRQMQLRDFYRTYSAGYSRMIWHVWAAEFAYGNFNWPGFSKGFFHPGTRHPASRDYDEYNAHLGRVHQLMRTGHARSDIAFVHNNWNQGIAFRAENHGTFPKVAQMNWQLAHMGIYYRSTELQDNGYSYDYFSPKFLSEDGVYFDAKTKTIEPAGYKAIVLYQDWLDINGAKKILAWAKKGIPVVLMPSAATRTPFEDDKDRELATTIAALKKLHNVRTAIIFDPIDNYFAAEVGGYHDNVMELMQQLGVHPYAGFPQSNLQLLTQTRQDDEGNRFVYVYNYDDGSYRSQSLLPEVVSAPNPGLNIKTQISVEGEYTPYSIDAWTGAVTQLANFSWTKGRTIVPIDLDYNNIALFAFEKTKAGQTQRTVRIDSTNADSSYATTKAIAVRATSSRTLTTKLTNGDRYRTTVTVPAPYDITGWSVTVTAWTPNPTERNLLRTETIDGLTTKNTLTSTVKTPIRVNLTTLTTWDNIPQVGKAVSGTGRYEATFTWNPKKASGAYLDFGTITESMKVWINGEKVGGRKTTNPTKVTKNVGGVGKPTIDDGTGNQVPLVGTDEWTGGVSITKPIIDISAYLKNGANSIVIEYSSSLQNLQISRGVSAAGLELKSWWENDQEYLSYGPPQAKIVPFAEVAYPVEH